MQVSERTQQNTPYIQLPELIDLFKDAPAFIANKPYKAVRLSKNGGLMVESQITEYMAAGLATVAQEVEKSQFALVSAHLMGKLYPLLDKKLSIAPEDLLDNHIEVMDVLSEDALKKDAIIEGPFGDPETVIYLDPLLQAIVAPKEMYIPSFMEPMGVEFIRTGQILVRSNVLGAFPYERSYRSLAADATFLNAHLAVGEGKQIIALESSAPHKNFAKALQQVQKLADTQNKTSLSS